MSVTLLYQRAVRSVKRTAYYLGVLVYFERQKVVLPTVSPYVPTLNSKSRVADWMIVAFSYW